MTGWLRRLRGKLRRGWEVYVIGGDGRVAQPPHGFAFPRFYRRRRAEARACDCNDYAIHLGYHHRYAVRRFPLGAPMSDQQPVPAIPGPRQPTE